MLFPKLLSLQRSEQAMPPLDRASKSSPWNSLEVAKLMVSAATPLFVALLAAVIWSTQRTVVERWEVQQQLDRRLAEAELQERGRLRDLRDSLYSQAGPLLNEILAYNFYVNRWKETSPATIIEKKRQLDSLMYSHEALFSPAFFNLYRQFMTETFRSARNWQGDTRLRTKANCRIAQSDEDHVRWRAWFTGEDNRRAVCIAHRNLLGKLAEELLLQKASTIDEATDDQKLSRCPPIYDLTPCN
jgi:hypothetical protein